MLQSSSRLAGRLCDVAVSLWTTLTMQMMYTYVLHYPSVHVVCVVACIVVVGHSVPAHQILFRPVTRILRNHCQKCAAKPPQNYRMITDTHRVRKKMSESAVFLRITLPHLTYVELMTSLEKTLQVPRPNKKD